MKKFAKIMLMVLGFGLVAVALVFLTSRPAPAQANRPPVPVTVTNPPLEPQVASDTVTLQVTSFFGPPCGPFGFPFNRLVVESGGNVTPFTLPQGKVLLVTSLDWLDVGNSAVANIGRTVFLWRFFGGGVNDASAQSTAIADSTGRAGGTETFPSGLVLQNPGQLCIGLDPTGPQLVPGESLNATLNGFLAPDK